MSVEEEIAAAARALAHAGLVDAFGHVSARSGEGALMTPPQPLGDLAADALLTPLPLDQDSIPAGVPKEAWIHWSIYRSRPDVAAICRAQPRSVLAAGAGGVELQPLHGQGALVGAHVPTFDDARLIRSRDRGEALGEALGGASALILRGNGAVTVGSSPGIAVARMHVLEASASLNLQVAATGTPGRPLSADELAAWDDVAEEILGRLWDYLRASS